MGSRILVVDDEEHIRRLCHHILSTKGYLPHSTSLPREALSHIESERFDLLLTDLAMPQIDGLELLRRAKEFRSDLPVVIITGHGTLDKAIQSLYHGADGFVIKPFSESELLTAVEEALEKSRLMQENLRLRLLMPLFEVTRNLLSERDLCSVLNQVLEVSRRETKAALSAILVEGEPVRFFPPPEGDRIAKYDALCREVAQRVRGRSDPLLLSAVAPSGAPKSPAFGVDLETGAQSVAPLETGAQSVAPLETGAQSVAPLETGAQSRVLRVNPDESGLPLRVRSRRPGDRFHPVGMTGTKKLQDLFVDAKIPRSERDRIPIVYSPRGIVWVAGVRADRRFIGEGKRSILLRYLPADARAG